MSTQLATASETAPKVTPLHLPSLDDKTIGDYELAVIDEVATLKAIQHQIHLEMERRMNERGGRELLHPGFEKIVLEDQYSPYAYDFDHLRQAHALLKAAGKDEDAAKVMRHIPESVTVIAAHDEPGNPVSIAALIRRHGEESEVGTHLSLGQTRVRLGTRLVTKPKVVKP